jgi:ATP-binding cassette, subfamily B (MDR/TAP), member 1
MYISVFSQYLMSIGTIRDNVSLSVDKSMASDSVIEEACRAAQIHDFVVSLPDGI